MFENCTEEARRLLFFARYEAAQRGGQAIEPEHLVLGLLRDGAQVLRFPLPPGSAETIYARVDAAFAPAEPMSASVEIPFSHATQVVLAQTVIEADALKNRSIRPEHLAIAIMARTDGAGARALRDAGIDPDAIREFLRLAADEPEPEPVPVRAPRSGTFGPKTIFRQWTGVVKPGAEAEYLRHLQSETLPAIGRIDGFAIAFILRRAVEDGTEFQVMTIWESLDAIQTFAGDDVTTAVVPPAAQALMVRYDERAVHYGIVTASG